jgi:predicted RNase H-like HicB family nuclease
MSRTYPVAVYKDDASDFTMVPPDLPGCLSAGTTLDEAVAMIREAIELHLDGMVDDGERPPAATTVETWRTHEDYADAVAWAFVEVELPEPVAA